MSNQSSSTFNFLSFLRKLRRSTLTCCNPTRMQRGIYCNVQREPHQSSASIVLYEILFLPLVKEPVKPLTQAEPPHPTLSRLFFFLSSI